MLRMSVAGKDLIPAGPKIIIANHPTTSDPFVLTGFANGHAVVLVKDTLFKVPVFGSYLHWAGHIPVIHNEGKLAFERALKMLKEGITVIVFIEGGTSTSLKKLKKPKTGAVRLSLLSGAPIIPMGISVKEKNIKFIKSVVRGIQELGKWYFRGPYAITVGKPIKLSGNVLNKTNVKNKSNWLMQKISDLIKQSNTRLKLQY